MSPICIVEEKMVVVAKCLISPHIKSIKVFYLPYNCKVCILSMLCNHIISCWQKMLHVSGLAVPEVYCSNIHFPANLETMAMVNE